MTYHLSREFDTIATDNTGLYFSIVGNSLNASISNYITANGDKSLSLEQASPPGLENALEAVMDDVSVAVASSQIMIDEQTELRAATLARSALRLGAPVYVRAVFGINGLVIACFVIEAFRTWLLEEGGGV